MLIVSQRLKHEIPFSARKLSEALVRTSPNDHRNPQPQHLNVEQPGLLQWEAITKSEQLEYFEPYPHEHWPLFPACSGPCIQLQIGSVLCTISLGLLKIQVGLQRASGILWLVSSLDPSFSASCDHIRKNCRGRVSPLASLKCLTLPVAPAQSLLSCAWFPLIQGAAASNAW